MFHVEHPPASPTTVLSVLRAGLRELDLDAGLAAPLASLCELLAQWGAQMNLTGHRTPDAIAQRLVLDALALAEALPVDAPESLADLGSGAGFPGLPLAVRWPTCRITLVEARERRHHFQRAAIRTLALSNVESRRGRLEALAPEPHAVVVAQALAQADQALDWMLRWVAPGGLVVLPQSADAPAFAAPPGLEDARTLTYRVPLTGLDRRVWVARRPVDAPAAPVVRTERLPR